MNETRCQVGGTPAFFERDLSGFLLALPLEGDLHRFAVIGIELPVTSVNSTRSSDPRAAARKVFSVRASSTA